MKTVDSTTETTVNEQGVLVRVDTSHYSDGSKLGIVSYPTAKRIVSRGKMGLAFRERLTPVFVNLYRDLIGPPESIDLSPFIGFLVGLNDCSTLRQTSVIGGRAYDTVCYAFSWQTFLEYKKINVSLDTIFDLLAAMGLILVNNSDSNRGIAYTEKYDSIYESLCWAGFTNIHRS